MSFNLNSLVSALNSVGITGSTLSSAVAAVAGLSSNGKIKAALTAILANSNNPAVIADEVKQIAELPNVPAGVINLLPSVTAATTPAAVVQAVQLIEAVLGSSGITIG